MKISFLFKLSVALFALGLGILDVSTMPTRVAEAQPINNETQAIQLRGAKLYFVQNEYGLDHLTCAVVVGESRNSNPPTVAINCR